MASACVSMFDLSRDGVAAQIPMKHVECNVTCQIPTVASRKSISTSRALTIGARGSGPLGTGERVRTHGKFLAASSTSVIADNGQTFVEGTESSGIRGLFLRLPWFSFFIHAMEYSKSSAKVSISQSLWNPSWKTRSAS